MSFISYIKDATALADRPLVETRMLKCLGCRMRQDSLIGSICGTFLSPSDEKGKETCGCGLELKWKLLNWHCPQKKW